MDQPARGPLVIPATEADLRPEWLCAVLASECPDLTVRGMEVKRIGEGYGLSSQVFQLRIDGERCPSSLVIKLWRPDGPAATREVLFYRNVGANAGVRIPRCYHGAFDPVAARGVLVLEALGDVEQGDSLRHLDRTRATILVRTLGAFQAAWWRRTELQMMTWLPATSVWEPNIAWISSRRSELLRRFRDQIHEDTLALLEKAEAVPARVNVRLGNAAVTLLHGDLHLDNILFAADTGAPTLLDWSRSAKGPATLDLCEVLFTIGAPEDREHLIAAYLDELRTRKITELDESSLRHQIGAALLRKFVAWTCGIAHWQPGTAREAAMVACSLSRAQRAIADWRGEDPSLFEL